MAKNKLNRPALNSEEFIKVWQTSSSLAEVSERLDRPSVHMSTKASQFRKKGVALKRFNRGGPVDWDTLVALAASFTDSK